MAKTPYVLLCCLGLVGRGPSAPLRSPDLTLAELKTEISTTLKDDKVTKSAPKIDVTDTQVTLGLGGLDRAPGKRPPFAYAIEEQAVIELFRIHMPQPKGLAQVDWETVLKAAEEV